MPIMRHAPSGDGFSWEAIFLGTHRLAVVNTRKKFKSYGGYFIDINVFVVYPGQAHSAFRISVEREGCWVDFSVDQFHRMGSYPI